MQHGGKAVYGASLGILMLEARFPRIHGDIGNAATWPFPVQYRVVRGASPDKVVCQDPMELADRFGDAARDLVAAGCDGLTTNCGFLALLQDRIAREVPVPVATSSLMQIPMVQRMLPPGRRVGVLTISKASLTHRHLIAAGVEDPAAVPVAGTDGGREFSRAILEDRVAIDFAACRLDMLDAARELVETHPDVGAIVLECTNMTPYAADIRKATGRTVYSIYSLVRWFQHALMPDRFELTLEDPRHDAG
ncbi:aspartate/glutamate racemase family protein [Rhodobacteraceae bacterium 2CG4]|uniref:Aspartate/glutamate racemase family protein n=1 Tax=Halovulum marinum TaxID=2662447 RepID=A0A6L5Z203_9RHOB|nr:aspartate/glutamate racemase family protein [Halovulum marinum]MSU90593.1 aspartate/glutamate racemase family protein [Halovulum marinum]